jgi:hypothetical protein
MKKKISQSISGRWNDSQFGKGARSTFGNTSVARKKHFFMGNPKFRRF